MILRELHAKGLDDWEIAKRMGFHRNTINRFRHRVLGLSANGPHHTRSRAKRSRKLRRVFKGEGRYLYATVCRVLAARLGWPGRCVREAFVLHALERLGPSTTPQLVEETNKTRKTFGRKPNVAGNVRKATCALQRAGFVTSSFLGVGKGWKVYELTDVAAIAAQSRLVAWQK